MQDFKQLKVWEKAHELILIIYRATVKFPKEEIYGLTSQIRRACVSIASNIAEGCARGSDADFARFLNISMGSSSELEYQILLSRDLQYLDDEEYEKINKKIFELKRMISGLLKKLRANS